MVGKSPGRTRGGRPLHIRLWKGIQRWSGPRRESEGVDPGEPGGLDGKHGGRREEPRGRAGGAKEALRGLGKEREGGRQGKGKGSLQQFGEHKPEEERIKERKEEEKEEEERSWEDRRYKGFSGGLWDYWPGPRSSSQEARPKESKEVGPEEGPEEQQRKQLVVEDQFFKPGGGGSLRDLWRRSESEVSGKKIPRCAHSQHGRADPDLSGPAVGATLADREGLYPTSVLPVLEGGIVSQDRGTDGSRDANLVLRHRPSPSGEDSRRLEQVAGGADYRIAQRQELVPLEAVSMTSAKESLEASRLQKEEARAKASAAKGWERRKDQVGERKGRQRPRMASRRRWQRRPRGEEGGEGKEGSVDEQGLKRKVAAMKSFDLGRDEEQGSVGRGEGVAAPSPKASGSALEALRSSSEYMCNSAPLLEAEPERVQLAESRAEFHLNPNDTLELIGLKYVDVSPWLNSKFDELRNLCNFKHSKIQTSGGIFPLPEHPSGLPTTLQNLGDQQKSCLVSVCRAMNSYFGVSGSRLGSSSRSSKAAVASLATYVEDASAWEEKFDGADWDTLFSTRTVDYHGEEVKMAQHVRWENLEPALPEGIGSIPLEEVCELGTLAYVSNFEEYLLPIEDQVYTRPPRVMVPDDGWYKVCSGLLERGICEVLPRREVYHLRGQPLLNGMFGVSKEEYHNSWEVHRLIMNLVPVNKLCRNLAGDIATLPNWAGMTPYLMEDKEITLMSSEDSRCFFYLFSIPDAWKRFMGFGKLLPAELVPPKWEGLDCVLVSRVLPMGFLNSVSIAQHVHRPVARMALHSAWCRS